MSPISPAARRKAAREKIIYPPGNSASLNTFYGGLGNRDQSGSSGKIGGAKITASGKITLVSAFGGPGQGGEIAGATISAHDLGILTASGNLSATITASGGAGDGRGVCELARLADGAF